MERTPRRSSTACTEHVSSDSVVYQATSDALAAPLQIKLDKNSGEISILKDGGAEETTKFYVGTVEAITENEFTLKVQGEEQRVTISLSGSTYRPVKGQKVFVATDPTTNTATKIDDVPDKKDTSTRINQRNETQ